MWRRWLALAVLAAGCAGTSDVAATRRLLAELREPALGFVKAAGPEGDVDGVSLVLRGGKVKGVSIDDLDGAPQDEWVVDEWGHPIVLVEDSEDPMDFCLISAGPDGVWTTDGPAERARYSGAESYPRLAPYYEARLLDGGRWVAGDDIVLHSSGVFFERYPHAVPAARDVLESAVSVFQGSPGAGLVPSDETRAEVEELSRDEREKAAALLKEHAGGFRLAEDTWSREEPRKDAFVPRLFLCHHALWPQFPPIWIEPGAAGWVLEMSPREMLETEEEDPAVPVALRAPLPFFGMPVDSEAVVLLLETTQGARESAAWPRLREEVSRFVTALPASRRLGIVLFGPEILTFPSKEQGLALADEPAKTRARKLLEELGAQDPARHAFRASLEEALETALDMAAASQAGTKAIVYAGTGKGNCREAGEQACLGRVIDAAARRNPEHMPIHAVALGVSDGSEQEAFLMKLTARDGGSYVPALGRAAR